VARVSVSCICVPVFENMWSHDIRTELEQQNSTMRGVVLQGEVDMAHLKKTLHELESIVDRLERINKEQVILKGENVCNKRIFVKRVRA
jgi:hypothetical protein